MTAARTRIVADFDREGHREAIEKSCGVRKVAQELGLDARALASVLKLPMYDAALLLAGTHVLDLGTVAFRNGLRLIRVAAALNALHEDDVEAKRAWVVSLHPDLGASPMTVMAGTEEAFEELADRVASEAQSVEPPIPH